jgi:hypothetical protein
MSGALKAMDLRRDGRVAIHGPLTIPRRGGSWRGEAKVAGRAIEVPSEDDSHGFRIDIEEVVVTGLNAERNRLVIESWSPAEGYRKRDRA